MPDRGACQYAVKTLLGKSGFQQGCVLAAVWLSHEQQFLIRARMVESQTRSLTPCPLSTVLVPYGKLDAASLRRAYEADPKQRLQLQLRKQARPGQKEALEHIPCYAHVRVRMLPQWSAVLCCAHVLSLAACTSDPQCMLQKAFEDCHFAHFAGNN